MAKKHISTLDCAAVAHFWFWKSFFKQLNFYMPMAETFSWDRSKIFSWEIEEKVANI